LQKDIKKDFVENIPLSLIQSVKSKNFNEDDYGDDQFVNIENMLIKENKGKD